MRKENRSKHSRFFFFERASVSSSSLKDAYFTFNEWNTAMWRGTCEPADNHKTRSFANYQCSVTKMYTNYMQRPPPPEAYGRSAIQNILRPSKFPTSKAVYEILFHVLHYMLSLTTTE